VPLNERICGLDASLSSIWNCAVRSPVACGVNVNVIVQVAFGRIDSPHVVVSEKSPGFAPMNKWSLNTTVKESTLVRFTVNVPVLPMATVPKSKLEAGSKSSADPVPVRGTDWGLLATLSEMVSAAVRAPSAVGVKVTVRVQVAPGAIPDLQVVVSVKSCLSPPVILMPVKLSVPVPLLVRVTVWGLLALFKA